MFFKKQKEKTEEKPMTEPQVSAYLNPLWQIAVAYNGKEVIRKPFSHFIYTYLKDYGFDVDEKINPSPVIIFEIVPGSCVKLPIFIKSFVNEEEISTITPEKALSKGLILK